MHVEYREANRRPPAPPAPAQLARGLQSITGFVVTGAQAMALNQARLAEQYEAGQVNMPSKPGWTDLEGFGAARGARYVSAGARDVEHLSTFTDHQCRGLTERLHSKHGRRASEVRFYCFMVLISV